MLNSISTSKAGSHEFHGVQAAGPAPGHAHAFGDLLAQLSAPSEDTTAAKGQDDSSNQTSTPAEAPKSGKDESINRASRSDRASLLIALPMPSPATVAPASANPSKVPTSDKDTPDSPAPPPDPSSLPPIALPMTPSPTSIVSAQTPTPTPLRDAGNSEPNSTLFGQNAAAAPTPATTPPTTVMQPMDFAAFDVKAIDVQTESMVAAPPHGQLKGAIDSRLLAELQVSPLTVLGPSAERAPLPDGNAEMSNGASAAPSPAPAAPESPPISTPVPGLVLASDAVSLNAADDAAQAKPLSEIRNADALTQDAGAAPVIADANMHGSSQQESGTEHEKHTADQSPKNEIAGVTVLSGASAPFQSQVAGSESSHPVSHMPELPPAPESLTAHRVSIDIGENESRVTVTLHERNGDVSVKIHSASEPLGTQLQSSVGSLVEALHREHVSLTNMDFTNGFAHTPDHGNPRDGQPQPSPRQPKIKTLVLPTNDVEFETAKSGINVNG